MTRKNWGFNLWILLFSFNVSFAIYKALIFTDQDNISASIFWVFVGLGNLLGALTLEELKER
jgi:hypothetical protein